MKSSGVVVPRQLKWHGRLAAGGIYLVLRSMAATVRLRWVNESDLVASVLNQPLIFCIWHNRLAVCLSLYRHFVQRHHPERRLAAMVSASKDGALSARVLEYFGVQPVRGSTNRRGPQALLELTSWAERGFDLAITPDGPRGPRYVIQDGIIALALLTGRPILPVAYHLNWKWCLRSWDRFQVPLLFARCDVSFGKPILVPSEADEVQRETLRQQLNQVMMDITRD
jgi:lysophospholipid acyltransferase (LPLAT)-like uncharacterized protein